MGLKDADIYIGLVHAPVYNKHKEIITTTITNLDLHDIARAGRTFNVRRYYVINPLKSQQSLVKRMQKYWISEFGGEYNSNRQEAFTVIDIASDLAETIIKIEEETGKRPKLIATSANPSAEITSFKKMRTNISKMEAPFLLIFGTGWGLTQDIMELCDYILAPIYGRGDFNHLSVRSAVSIILDRLLAEDWWQ